MKLSALSNAVEKTANVVPMSAKPSLEKKRLFQATLMKELKEMLEDCNKAEIEFQLSDLTKTEGCAYNDRCDVFVETSEFCFMVEIDTTRADQVAKKMLSRYYYSRKISKPVIYLCLLYPGTSKMNPNECVKYMTMGKEIFQSLDNRNQFMGGFINGKKVDWIINE